LLGKSPDRVCLWFRPIAHWLFPLPRCLQSSASGHDAKLFFGEIPIQYVGPGEKIVLDLHRFLNSPEASVHVDGRTPVRDFHPKLGRR